MLYIFSIICNQNLLILVVEKYFLQEYYQSKVNTQTNSAGLKNK